MGYGLLWEVKDLGGVHWRRVSHIDNPELNARQRGYTPEVLPLRHTDSVCLGTNAGTVCLTSSRVEMPSVLKITWVSE